MKRGQPGWMDILRHRSASFRRRIVSLSPINAAEFFEESVIRDRLSADRNSLG
jgi:hypothetical protein